MKRLLVRFSIFILPIILIAILMETLLRNTPNDYLFKKNYLDENSTEIETLILGSSHSYYGLNPEYFKSNTFNASHISQSLNFDYEILNKYKHQFRNLKTIVLPISYFTLYGKLESGGESWRVKNYVLYYGLNSSTSFTDSYEILSNRLKLNIKRLVKYYLLGDSNITCNNLGWGTRYNSNYARDLKKTGISAAKRHTREDINSIKYRQIFDENILILNSILQWGKNNGVKILLLTPPAYETYRKNLNAEQLNSTISTTAEICSKYENCIYENLLDDSSFVAEDFYDADHLSEVGAKKLSELINLRIIEWE